MLVTYADAFLLSIDAQTTIGFGNYAVDSDCAPGILILVVQVCWTPEKEILPSKTATKP